nr:MAG TPA: endonuclease [Caudoviricetes sp.]
MKKILFSDEQIKEIKKMYDNNYSLTNIGDTFNCNRSVIKRVLIENNYYNENRRCKKYPLDEQYFLNIDSSEKAYWLGFIAADGCVSERENCGSVLSFNLNYRDKEHLSKFLEAIKSSAVIKEHKGSGFGENTTIAHLEINSTAMVKDLKKYGIVPKKSLILKPPIEFINKKYYLPYIKGYFDGDGTIYKSSNNFIIGFCGTAEMLNWIKEQLNVDNKLEKRKDDEKNSYSFRVGGTAKTLQILEKFYFSSKTSLKRKEELVLELKSRLEK